MKKYFAKILSMALCAALMLTLLPATALAADVTLEVNHATAGNLAAEITAAIGADDPASYTKLKVNVGAIDLSGRYNSGDWQVLFGLPGTLPNVTSLELAYTSGEPIRYRITP